MKKKIYHLSAPFETINSGDYDYGTALIKGFTDKGQAAHYLTLPEVESSSEKIEEIAQGVAKLYLNDLTEFNSQLENWKINETRKEVVNKVKNFILKDKDTKPVLNLQLRSPETGFLFVPEDMKEFKKAGIEVNITCHEYKLNLTRPHYQAVLHEYFKNADTVSFFNFSDLTEAGRHANKSAFEFGNLSLDRQREWNEFGAGKFAAWSKNFKHEAYNLVDKMILTRVPPTVGHAEVTYEQFQNRKADIVVFGSIRGAKGITEALDIAVKLKEKLEQGTYEKLRDTRVIIAGNPTTGETGAILLSKILKAKYDNNQLKEKFQTSIKGLTAKLNGTSTTELQKNISELDAEIKAGKYAEKAPIDLVINPTAEQVVKLYENAKYAVKYDNKGWANNASGHIAPLTNGCIVYTGWGMNTAEEVTTGKHANSIVFLSRQYGLKENAQLTLEQELNGGQQKHYNNNSKESNLDPVTADKVLNDLNRRETDPNLNKNSFEAAARLKLEFTERAVPDFLSNITDVEARYKQYQEAYVKEELTKIETERMVTQLRNDAAKLTELRESLDGKIISEVNSLSENIKTGEKDVSSTVTEIVSKKTGSFQKIIERSVSVMMSNIFRQDGRDEIVREKLYDFDGISTEFSKKLNIWHDIVADSQGDPNNSHLSILVKETVQGILLDHFRNNVGQTQQKIAEINQDVITAEAELRSKTDLLSETKGSGKPDSSPEVQELKSQIKDLAKRVEEAKTELKNKELEIEKMKDSEGKMQEEQHKDKEVHDREKEKYKEGFGRHSHKPAEHIVVKSIYNIQYDSQETIDEIQLFALINLISKKAGASSLYEGLYGSGELLGINTGQEMGENFYG